MRLEFTPLEFETIIADDVEVPNNSLEFTPLEFETENNRTFKNRIVIRIYSVGV